MKKASNIRTWNYPSKGTPIYRDTTEIPPMNSFRAGGYMGEDPPVKDYSTIPGVNKEKLAQWNSLGKEAPTNVQEAQLLAEAVGYNPQQAVIVAAQWALESGQGKKTGGDYNYFGIKSHNQSVRDRMKNAYGIETSAAEEAATSEYEEGKKKSTKASFLNFQNPIEAFLGHKAFLETNARYKKALEKTSPAEFVEALGEAGYATDVNYKNKIASIAKPIIGEEAFGTFSTTSSKELDKYKPKYFTNNSIPVASDPEEIKKIIEKTNREVSGASTYQPEQFVELESKKNIPIMSLTPGKPAFGQSIFTAGQTFNPPKMATQSNKKAYGGNINLFQNGGGDPPTLYVNPNDPTGRARYQAYQDSLQDYNFTSHAIEKFRNKTGTDFTKYSHTNMSPNQIKNLYGEDEYERVFIKEGREPIGGYVLKIKDENDKRDILRNTSLPISKTIGIYKKPVQPVKYRDPEIVAKQQQLIDAGFNIGKADGIWGPKSQAAWEQMQTKSEIPSLPNKKQTSIKTIAANSIPNKDVDTTLTKQVPKTQWKQLPNGTWYKDTKAGQNATVESVNNYKNGGGDPPPNFFNFDPTPEYVGYQGRVPVAESTRVVNTYRPTQQEIKATKEYSKKVGDLAQDIKKESNVSQKVAMQQAEQILEANSRIQPEAKAYANTKQAQERDAYVFDEGMNARDYFRYPLQFLAGRTPTAEERIQDRIRITDPRTSNLDKFMGTAGQAMGLAPEALINTGVGLAFAPSRFSKLGQVVDAVSPIGNPTSPFNTRAQNDILVEQARRSGEATLPSYMEPYISRRYTPAAKEQDIFESFLSPEKQADLRQSRTQTFTPEEVNTPKQLPGSSVDDMGRGVNNLSRKLKEELSSFNPKNLKSKPGIDWIKKWYNNPDFERRYSPTGKYSPYMMQEHILKQLNEYQPKNYLDLLKDKGIKEYLNRGITTGGVSWGVPEHIYHNRAMFAPFGKKQLEKVKVHELTHLIENNGNFLSEADEKTLLKPFNISDISDIPKNSFFKNLLGDKPEYYLDPTEIHARMNEARFDLGLTPKDKFTEKMFEDILKNKNWYGMGKYIKDKKSFIDLMNNFWVAPAAIATATGAGASSNEYKQGGNLNTFNYQQNTLPLQTITEPQEVELTPEEINYYRSLGYEVEELD